MKASEGALAKKRVLETSREINVVLLDHEDEVKSSLHAVDERRFLQAAAAFETDFKTVGATKQEAATDPDRLENKDVHKIQD